MATTLRSYAKINLGLTIGPVRGDGFHDLRTVYKTIDVWDRVTVSAAVAERSAIRIVCGHPYVPCDQRNTTWKAAEALLDALAVMAEVEIIIEKRLPVQGGLGAGSANAAAVLVGLERELARLGVARTLTPEQRFRIAARVGSDVPLFLVGGASFGYGRGEQVVPLADSRELACVVALPGVPVSTPQAFREWDRQALTVTPSPDRIDRLGHTAAAAWSGALGDLSGVVSTGDDLAQDPVLTLVHTGIENDFEKVVFPQHPLLRDLRAALAGDVPGIPSKDKALAAMLSGSGSSLFGLYTSDAAAEAAASRVRTLGAEALVTQTISRRRYWQEMMEVSR